MLKVITKEYRENDKAYHIKTVYIFGVLLYVSTNITTNKDIIASLTTIKHKKVIGFRNETENKSKKIK